MKVGETFKKMEERSLPQLLSNIVPEIRQALEEAMFVVI